MSARSTAGHRGLDRRDSAGGVSAANADLVDGGARDTWLRALKILDELNDASAAQVRALLGQTGSAAVH